MAQYIPIEDHILVKPLAEDHTTAAWIVLPDSAKDKPSKWVVLAVGEGKILENGSRGPIDVKEGDVVYFTKYSPDELEVVIDGKKEKILVIRHSSILAKEAK